LSEDLLEQLGIAKGQAEGGTIVIETSVTFELHGVDELEKELNSVHYLAVLEERE